MSELYKALAKFQGAIGTIPKTVQGHGYKYADLDTIWDAIRKPLQDAGLVVVQLPTSDRDQIGLKTILAHTSGESVESVMYAPEAQTNARMTAIQAAGSSLTYMRRYMLSSVLGLTTDEDTDGAWIEDNKRSEQEEKQEQLRQQIAQAVEGIEARCSVFESKDDFSKLKAELLGKFGFVAQGKKVLPSEITEALNAAFEAAKERGVK